MAMERIATIQTNHNDTIIALAYNQTKREVYTAAQGETDIHVWDVKSCVERRRLSGHKGCVTAMVFDDVARVLFSIALDGNLIIWTEREAPLHIYEIGDALISMAIDTEAGVLAVGKNKALHLFTIDFENLNKLLHDDLADREETSLTKEQAKKRDRDLVFERLVDPLVGPQFCSSDNVQCITFHAGKVIAAGYDGSLCIYDLEKPKEIFTKINKAHSCAISSLRIDSKRNLLLTGSYDGAFSLWSVEGRRGDALPNVSDGKVVAAYVSPSDEYWIIGRGGQILIFDPNGPTNITEFVSAVSLPTEDPPTQFLALYAPDDTSTLIGVTTDRKITLWNYNRVRAHRTFKNRGMRSIECAITASRSDEVTGAIKTDVIVGDTVGSITLWQYDVETSSNIYYPEHCSSSRSSSVLSIVYMPQQSLYAFGCDDGTIVLSSLKGISATESIEPSRDVTLHKHTDKVVALAVMGDGLLLSGSFDRSLRVWYVADDAVTEKHVTKNAHSYPIQCVEAVEESRQVASCSLNHLVKIWSVDETGRLEMLFTLNHRTADPIEKEIRPSASTQPTIATCATIDGEIGLELSPIKDEEDIVQQAILQADLDVPEVTQVRWVSYKQQWLTAATDEMLRLWDSCGRLTYSFRYKGSAAQCLFIDEKNHFVLISTLDMTVSVITLDQPVPITKFRGHTDVVASILYIPERDVYLTASWDGSLKLWLRPKTSRAICGPQLRETPSFRMRKSPRSKLREEAELNAQAEPVFLKTDYSSWWKRLEMMKEYEERCTEDWTVSATSSLLPFTGALPQAPQRLAVLLDEENERTKRRLLRDANATS